MHAFFIEKVTDIIFRRGREFSDVKKLMHNYSGVSKIQDWEKTKASQKWSRISGTLRNYSNVFNKIGVYV